MSWTITPSFTQWTPALISTALWLDAADNATVFSDAGTTQAIAGSSTVQQWNDKSGNSRHVTQASVGARPAYGSLQINGRNTLTFITDDSLARISPGLVTGASARSMFVVYKPNTTGSSNTICGQSYSGAPNTWFVLQHRSVGAIGDPYFAAYSNDLTDGVSPTTAAKIGGVTYDGSSLVLYRNGNQIASKTTTLATDSTTEFAVGRNGQSTEYMDGSIAEIIFTHSALTANDREKLEGYLAHKWGLTANLPSNHPYKVNPPAP